MEKSAVNEESETQLEHNEDLELEVHDNSSKNPNTGEDNIPLSQCNDQEESTLDERSKTSIPDTPSLTIRDGRYVEAARIYLEACSRITDLASHVPGEEQLSGLV